MKIETRNETREMDGRRGNAVHVTRLRALVVEDEQAMRTLIEEAMGAAGIDTVTLMNSAETHSRFNMEKFDLIVVDVSAQSQRGEDMIRRLRSSGFNCNTPVIMISNDQRPGALSNGFKAGASFFAYKPIDKAHLMQLIKMTQGSIEQEKRRFRRIPVEAKVRVQCADSAVEGKTIDVSLNGALIQAAPIFPTGSPVEVSLYLPVGAHPVVGAGSVARVVSYNKMGIQFERLSVAESARLQEYLLPLVAV